MGETKGGEDKTVFLRIAS